MLRRKIRCEGWARPGQSRGVALDFEGIMKGHMEMRQHFSRDLKYKSG